MWKLQVHLNGLKEFTTTKLKNSGNFYIKYRDTLSTVWKVNGRTAGYTKSAGKLQLATVNNAGHLVPMDQGEAARAMMQGFVQRAVSS